MSYIDGDHRTEDADAVDRNAERRRPRRRWKKARLTRILARLHEEAGRISEAASVMQEVAIETYGALSKREKVFLSRSTCCA